MSSYNDKLDLQKKFILFGWLPIPVLIWLDEFFGLHQRTELYIVESRKKVNEQFLKIGIDEEDNQYALKGSTSTIIQDKESNGGGDEVWPTYNLTRFARNSYGEYFMLMFTVINGEVSMIYNRHIVQTNARIALKDKYVPLKNAGESQM